MSCLLPVSVALISVLFTTCFCGLELTCLQPISTLFFNITAALICVCLISYFCYLFPISEFLIDCRIKGQAEGLTIKWH